MKFLIRIWSNRGESTYNFGPFETEEDAQKFLDEKFDNTHWGDGSVEVLNHPQTLTTRNYYS